MIIATVTDQAGKTSAIPATYWTPIKKQMFEVAAAKTGMTITYSTR